MCISPPSSPHTYTPCRTPLPRPEISHSSTRWRRPDASQRPQRRELRGGGVFFFRVFRRESSLFSSDPTLISSLVERTHGLFFRHRALLVLGWARLETRFARIKLI